MATAGRKTDEVLASARRELQAQLSVVRDEQARLAAEERVLTQALSSLNGDSSSSATDGSTPARSGAAKTKSSARKATPGRRRQRGSSKSTADRVEELRGLLADGPRSRSDLAAELRVSPARVQQLLAELGSAVSSQPDPQRGRVKLWSLKDGGNGASAAETGSKRTAGRTKRTASSTSARKDAGAK